MVNTLKIPLHIVHMFIVDLILRISILHGIRPGLFTLFHHANTGEPPYPILVHTLLIPPLPLATEEGPQTSYYLQTAAPPLPTLQRSTALGPGVDLKARAFIYSD
jgi:hypothetical protein